MKKRIAVLLLVIVAAVCAFAGCNTKTPPEPKPEPEEKFTVTFDWQNGDEAVEVPFDEDFAEPAIIENGDKIFDGWYSDSTFKKAWKKPNELTENVTVYAKWMTIGDVLAKFDTVKFINFTVTLELTEGANTTVTEYAYFSDDVRYTYKSGDESITEYLERTNDGSHIYWKWNGTEPAHHDDIPDTDARYSAYASKLVVIDMTDTKDYAFTKDGDHYVATAPATVGGHIIDSTVTWTGVSVYVADGKVSKLVATKAGATYTFVFTNYSKSSFSVPTVYVPEHTHDFGDNYLMFVKCSYDRCSEIGRNQSTDSAKENFQFTFNDAKRTEIDAVYNAMLDNLDAKQDEPALEDLFMKYDDYVNYVVEQYQYAKVFYACDAKQYKETFDMISQYYTDTVTRYYSIFGLVYEIESYRDLFYEGWTPEEIQTALDYSDSYGSGEYKEIKDAIDALLLEYDQMLENMPVISNVYNEMFDRLVALNNRLAKQVAIGDAKYDNFMDYAYAVKYEREYTTSEVAAMRENVKKYIVPVFDSTYKQLMDINSQLNKKGFETDADKELYFGVLSETMFNNYEPKYLRYTSTGANYMAEYFKEMASDKYANNVDFYEYANKLFKEGNYYLGESESETAFSYWIPNQNMSILYFNEGYQDAFTFVHEFGHYYNGIYNNGLNLSMDHDETQSQGDEMMFLAWLATHADENVTETGYNAVMYYEIVNMLYVVVIATAVDEFEQAAYSGIYNGQPISKDKDGNTDYNTLFKTILASYGTGMKGNEAYWFKVAFHSSGYYISYAMSAVPCVELYVKAMNNFDEAKDSYIKLYTFSDNPEFVETDEDGNRSVIGTYADILKYCGLGNLFTADIYKQIGKYFMPDYNFD